MSFDWQPLAEKLDMNEKRNQEAARSFIHQMREIWNQNAGPFRILEKVGNAYKLDLPITMKIHSIFSPDKLRKDSRDPLPGQTIRPPDPIEIDGENEWEIDRILASRISRSKLQYRVRWKGFDEDSSWYPARDFKGSPHAIRDFHEANPTKAGPPRRLDEWLKAWETDSYLKDEVDDDLPA
ncbi:hypothetical protein PAAG_12477 [Paracoccidioides lutzii Pb01]|uniref:Chromo domain-containing protein n=1 Tax=Paracoccidioides lutzii (strain ATCC MYA-826 / Pb01) TaxID=502779 RepID=A0A0A2V3W7_PARBA|nr:hypothetical protein PAAG_12477 [Paracoccidioides lutzii Pb01]KGQ00850.1 hypothetical protein PAAG_12477 [Paracoccidioides lutzii Pb01]